MPGPTEEPRPLYMWKSEHYNVIAHDLEDCRAVLLETFVDTEETDMEMEYGFEVVPHEKEITLTLDDPPEDAGFTPDGWTKEGHNFKRRLTVARWIEESKRGIFSCTEW